MVDTSSLSNPYQGGGRKPLGMPTHVKLLMFRDSLPMITTKPEVRADVNPQETSEWLEALQEVIGESGPQRATFLLNELLTQAAARGVTAPLKHTTPYVNTIPAAEEVPYPGNLELERRIQNYIRWNAMAMVVRANKYDANIGGHISTYASLSTITEVGFNHFFNAR